METTCFEYMPACNHERTLVVNSRADYCNSVLHRVSAANVQPLQNLLKRRSSNQTA